METDAVIQYILGIAPAVASIISMIATIVVSIRKMKKITDDNAKKLGNITVLAHQLMEENKELKREIRKSINKISTVEELANKK